jgi:hypothetical protein
MANVNQVWVEQMNDKALVEVARSFRCDEPSMFGVSMFGVGSKEVVYVASDAVAYFVRSGRVVSVVAMSEKAAIAAVAK